MSEKDDDSVDREEEDAREAESAAPAATAAAGQTAATFGLMRYVHAIFFGGAVALAWLFIQIVDTTWTRLNLQFTWMPAPRDWMTVAISGVAGFGVAIYMWRHPKVNRLAVEVVTELSKVTWPTRKELSASTVVVIVVSIIASIILGVFDMFWAKLTDLILKI
jgi:preprotein translocase subunit SecE